MDGSTVFVAVLAVFAVSAALMTLALAGLSRLRRLEAQRNVALRAVQAEVDALRDGAIWFGRRQIRFEQQLARIQVRRDEGMSLGR